MGNIRKQGILYSIFSYAGFLLAYVNVLFLYPKAITAAEYGLATWIIYATSAIGLVGQLGLPTATIKYFPLFSKHKEKLYGFLTFMLCSLVFGVLLVILLAVVFKQQIFSFYDAPESLHLLAEYYWLIIPFVVALCYFNLLASYTVSFQKTAITAFLREFLQRVFVTVLLLGCLFNFWDFKTFMYGLVIGYFVQLVLLVIYLVRIGEFKLNFNFGGLLKSHLKELYTFGFITMLAGSVTYIISIVDTMMVSTLSEGELADAGIYNIFFRVGIIISVPYKAILSSSFQLISSAFKTNDLPKIENLYKRSSNIMTVFGVLLLIIILANLDNAVSFLGADYAKGKWVGFLIGLSTLINVVTSVNGVIIQQSSFYRYDLYTNIFLIGLAIATNWWLIPIYGLMGAALATLITQAIYNFTKLIIVKQQLNMQPFTNKTLLILLLGISVGACHFLLPQLNFWLIDALYRTTILGLLFCIGIYTLKLSPDITDTLHLVLNKIFKRK